MRKRMISLLLAGLLLLTAFSGTTVYAAKTGWVNSGDSRMYYDAGGNRLRDGLYEIDGKAYLFDAYGKTVMQKGWYKVDIADACGNDAIWYYLNGDGTAYRGWKEKDGKRYFFAYEMVTRPIRIDGEARVFAADGTLVTQKGWYARRYDNGVKYYWYINARGRALTGWHKLGGKWYHFDTLNGMMYRGGTFKTSDGRVCYFNRKGVWRMPKGWIRETVAETVDDETVTQTYYSYYKNGYGVTGWQKIRSRWYYFSQSGIMATGWQKIGKYWYYFYPNGTMATGTVEIDGKTYTFSAAGVLQK